jgi:hypothetical protein
LNEGGLEVVITGEGFLGMSGLKKECEWDSPVPVIIPGTFCAVMGSAIRASTRPVRVRRTLTSSSHVSGQMTLNTRKSAQKTLFACSFLPMISMSEELHEGQLEDEKNPSGFFEAAPASTSRASLMRLGSKTCWSCGQLLPY